MLVKFFEIIWDATTAEMQANNLPSEFIMSFPDNDFDADDAVSYASNLHGFCLVSVNFEIIDDA